MVKHLKIIISGAPLEGKSIKTFEKKVIYKMSKSTKDPMVEKYNFAMLHFRYEFTAVNIDMNKIDTLHSQIIRLTMQYLNRWTYHINIKYTEAEED